MSTITKYDIYCDDEWIDLPPRIRALIWMSYKYEYDDAVEVALAAARAHAQKKQEAQT